MDAIRFRCSACQQLLRVNSAKAGRKVRCLRCSEVLVVPKEESPDQEADDDAAEEPTPKMTPPTRKMAGKPRREPADSIAERLTDEEDGNEPDADEPEKKREPKRRRRSEVWRWARLGVLVLLVGCVLALLNMLVSQLLSNIVLASVSRVRFSLESLLVILLGLLTLVTLVRLIGYALCLFAPAESGARLFAILALGSMLLNTAVMSYGTYQNVSLLREGYNTPRINIPKDPGEREEYYKEMESRLKENAARYKAVRERQALIQIVDTVLRGVYLICVPLMLRAFCRSLKLVELEANCDGLLKIGVGMIGIDLVLRVVVGLMIFQLAAVAGCFSGLLSLAWEALALALLYQLWQAMPGSAALATRRS